MRKRDTAFLTLGAAVIVVLLFLLFSNVFVYLPLKTLYGGPAETATATTEIECSTQTCEITIEPTVFGYQENITAIHIYNGTHKKPPDGNPVTTIEKPDDGIWEDKSFERTLPKNDSYTITFSQSYKPKVSGAARAPYSIFYRPLFGQPQSEVVAKTVEPS